MRRRSPACRTAGRGGDCSILKRHRRRPVCFCMRTNAGRRCFSLQPGKGQRRAKTAEEPNFIARERRRKGSGDGARIDWLSQKMQPCRGKAAQQAMKTNGEQTRRICARGAFCGAHAHAGDRAAAWKPMRGPGANGALWEKTVDKRT